MASLMRLKDSFSLLSHLNEASFLVISCNDFTILEKLGINL